MKKAIKLLKGEMIRRALLQIIMIMLPIVAFAENIHCFEGLWYNLNDTNKTVSVIYVLFQDYPRDIVIPSEILINGETYAVTALEDKAFFGYVTSINSIVVPNSVTSIGQNAFADCEALTSVTLSCNLDSLGYYAFWGCISLQSIEIPNSLKYISSCCFYNCKGLSTINIPNNVIGISYNAFSGCSGLSSISIPKSVKVIKDGAFASCSGITDVYCYAEDVPKTDYGAFDGTPIEKSTLYVPAKSVDAYRASWPWSNFKKIVAIGSIPADDLKSKDYIYEAGINNSWGAKEQPLYSANKDGIYRGFFYAQEADWTGGKGAFKFTGAFNSWLEGNYGIGNINADGLSGTLIDDENSGNILATSGFYRADVNLGNMTYELTPISSIGIIGSAQAGGWDTDTDLTYNPETLAWEGTMKLTAGEFKFRANGSWDINWGGSIKNLLCCFPNKWIIFIVY